MTDIRTRFMEAYAYLLKEGLVTGYKDFASKISVSTSMITEISKERSNVGMTAIQNIVISFPVNADWLLTGRGSMLRSAPEPQPVRQPATQQDLSGEAAIYYKMYKEEKEEKEKLNAKMLQMAEELGSLKNQLSQSQPKPTKQKGRPAVLGSTETVPPVSTK